MIPCMKEGVESTVVESGKEGERAGGSFLLYPRPCLPERMRAADQFEPTVRPTLITQKWLTVAPLVSYSTKQLYILSKRAL